jgi:hypothetical protein
MKAMKKAALKPFSIRPPLAGYFSDLDYNARLTEPSFLPLKGVPLAYAQK